MGMDADIIAIGRFRKDIVGYLDYPEDYYKATPEGTEVLVTLFQCETTTASQELAEVLGIHPWRFEEHKLRLDENVIHELSAFVEEYDRWGEHEALEALHKAGFTFYYRPNG